MDGLPTTREPWATMRPLVMSGPMIVAYNRGNSTSRESAVMFEQLDEPREGQRPERSEKKVTLAWAIAAVLFTSPLLFLFMYFGRSGAGRAAWFCAMAIFLAVRFRWELSRKKWFWLSIAAISLIHIPLILFFPWTAAWVPSALIFPLVLIDVFLVLALIHRVEKLMRRRRTS